MDIDTEKQICRDSARNARRRSEMERYRIDVSLRPEWRQKQRDRCPTPAPAPALPLTVLLHLHLPASVFPFRLWHHLSIFPH